jgi:hypothetical protein
MTQPLEMRKRITNLQIINALFLSTEIVEGAPQKRICKTSLPVNKLSHIIHVNENLSKMFSP